jgi:ribA/ribD-fused uncharacterized protein
MSNLERKEIIKFYRARGPYGFLSNLYKKPIIFEDREFSSSEYAYQFGKIKDADVREWAMLCPKPHILAGLAHSLLSWDIVKNWSTIRFERMHKVLQAKFSDPDLKEKLLNTGDSILIENSKTDGIWGIGKKGNGKNMLGKLLMQVRKELRNKK